MFKRKYKKQNRLLRILLRWLKIYAVERDNFNLINPSFENKGKAQFLFNNKSFVFPNGYVDLKRKIKKLDIILRYTGSVNLWNTSQRWRRIIPKINKETLILSCFNSLTSSISHSQQYLGKQANIAIHLVDDGHQKDLNDQLIKQSEEKNIEIKYHKNENQGNRESFLKCLEISKSCEDLILFVEDDYLFEIDAILEMIASYSRLSTMLGQDINMSPTDYSFYYDGLYKTAVMLGSDKKYRFVGETLMTFMTSREIINKNYDLIKQVSERENDPFELPLHELYKTVPCLAPIGSLAYHISTIAPGLTPHADWKNTWDENLIKHNL